MICELCFHHCDLEEGQTGLCRARACRNGAIIPLNYGELTSLARWLASVNPNILLHLSRLSPGIRCLTSRPRRSGGYTVWLTGPKHTSPLHILEIADLYNRNLF